MIFAGSWCYRYLDKEIMEMLDYEEDPILLQTHEELEDCRNKTQKIAERFIKAAGNALNEYHGINEAYTYWYFILTEWMHTYIFEYYARYCELVKVMSLHPNCKIFVCSEKSIQNSEDITMELAEENQQEKFDYKYYVEYSKLLYSIADNYDVELIHDNDVYKWQRRTAPDTTTISNAKGDLASILKQIAHNIYDVWVNIYARKATIYGIYATKHSFHVLLSLRGQYRPFNLAHITQKFTCKRKLLEERKKIKINLFPENEFEQFLLERMPLDMPVEWIEDYDRICKLAKSKLIKAPKALCMQFGTPLETVLLGCWKKRGTIFIKEAHSLGESLFSHPANANQSNADIFYVWRKSTRGKQFPKPIFKKYMLETNMSKENKEILWCGSCLESERYSSHVNYAILNRIYFGQQITINMRSFLEELNNKCKEVLRYRYRDVTGWGSKKFFQDIYPELMTDDQIPVGKMHIDRNMFFEKCLASRIIIVETVATAVILETLLCNRPLIIIDSTYMLNSQEYYDDVLPMFQKLKEIGILYENGAEAARFINTHYDDIEVWWNQPERQKVRKEFVDKFCFSVKDTDKWIIGEIQRLLNEV